MSALEETRTATQTGKSTRGGAQLPAGEATRTLTLPHPPYADAVHVELAAVGLRPDVLEAGLRTGTTGGGELFLRLVWLPHNPGLSDAVMPHGLTLAWSHVTGWSTRTGGDVVLLDVHEFSAPAVIADAARHLADHGHAGEWLQPCHARWEHAHALDHALAAWEDREAVLL